jgi:hypothetical protein
MRRHGLFTTGIAVFSGVVFGLVMGSVAMGIACKHSLRLAQASDLIQTVAALYRLREDTLTSGIEVLENRVDRGVVAIGIASSTQRHSATNDVERALVFVRKYRTRYPHTNELRQQNLWVNSPGSGSFPNV